MSYNYNQPPPYGSQPQSPTVPSGSSNNPRLPQYYDHHVHHHYRYKVPNNTSTLITTRLHVPTSLPLDHSQADARALDRFWSAAFLGFFIWLAIITFTDGLELLRLAIIGLAGAIQAIIDHILRDLRNSGWAI